jgi:hypothetical protein
VTTDLAIMAAALVVGTAIAALLGAANLGIALTFGVFACAAAGVWVILRRP